MSKAAGRSVHEIVFLRHAESVGNAEGRFQGQSDPPLTETGLAQARALARRWQEEKARFDCIISSPLRRARHTAEIIAETLGVPLEFDPDWMEWHNGELAGLTHEEVGEHDGWPDLLTPYVHIGETGESRWELYLRAGRAIQRLLDRPPGRYLVVAHGGVLNMALYGILGLTLQVNFQGISFRFRNTAFATLRYEADSHRWYVLGINDHAHWHFSDED